MTGGAVIPTFRPGEYIGAMTRVANPDGTPLDVTDVRQATWGELEAGGSPRRRPGSSGPTCRGSPTRSSPIPPPYWVCARRQRAAGDYVLSGSDVTAAATFPDAVARGAWPRETTWRAGPRVMSSCPTARPTRCRTGACCRWGSPTSWWPGAASRPTTTCSLGPGDGRGLRGGGGRRAGGGAGGPGTGPRGPSPSTSCAPP